jgi:hypothetical protein
MNKQYQFSQDSSNERKPPTSKCLAWLEPCVSRRGYNLYFIACTLALRLRGTGRKRLVKQVELRKCKNEQASGACLEISEHV